MVRAVCEGKFEVINQEIRSRKSELGSKKSDVRSQKLEFNSQK